MLQELTDYYEEYCRSIRAEAEHLRNGRMPRITEEVFAIFENTGNRLTYEDVYFLRRKYLAVFGLKAVLDGEKEDLEKLEEVLADVCAEECWALPAHVNRKADPDWRICVDLFAAETAQTLSEITFLLKGRLSDRIMEKVRDEVMRRVLIPFYRSEAPCGGWEYNESNWCAVCGGGVGSAAIYLLQEEPEMLEGILGRICYSLEHYYLKGFAGDGTCLEGLGYFTYGMTYFAGFAEQLYRFSGGKRDLFRIQGLDRIAAFQAKCYFKSGRTVSFADGSMDDTFRPGLTCFLAMKYPEAGIPAMERAAGLNDDTCYRWMALYRNLTWTQLYLDKLAGEEIPQAEREELKGQIVLPDAQWTICQSKNGAGMGAKGGHNDEPHNHNDIGSFFYLDGKDFLLADLGCGEYTKDYFSEKRYSCLCCRSLGHNVPLIDGKEQLPGREYSCDLFKADGRGRTVISFGKAYGNPRLESLTRTLEWNPEDGSLQVEDLCRAIGERLSMRENLVTGRKPRIEGNLIRIQGEERGCLIQVEEPLGEIQYILQDFSDHGGVRRNVWLIQWEAKGQGAETKARFIVMPA